MDAKLAQSFQFSTLIDSNNIARKSSGSVQFSKRSRELEKLRVLTSANFQPAKASNRHRNNVSLDVSCSYKNSPAPILGSGSFQSPFDEGHILKNKVQEIEPYLNGRCIYLVGMMGSGKTTVGKVLSQVLGYSFSDSDVLVEHEVGTSVAEIFKLYGEGFFREKETEILRKLSMMHWVVISTGGGAVVRPINWKHMKKGISVYIDVPLDALAQRIAAVGTASRPLLHQGSGDTYSKTYMRLSTLLEERSDAYANANARVSLENIAAKRGVRDVSNLTPTAIAIEALEQIEEFLKGGGGYYGF